MAFHSVLEVLLCFLFLSRYLPNYVQGQPQVPCHFIFGDSFADAGTNNNLLGVPIAKYSPYGVDFVNGPTGRFTNGRTYPDIIGQHLGFTDFTPPFTNLGGADILKGVNYASGGSGILDDTGVLRGVRTFSQQLENHRTIFSRIVGILGSETAARQHLGRCIYTVITGNNDYIGNYFQAVSITRLIYTPQQFADRLASMFDQKLRTLYTLGARKVAVSGVLPVGDAPQVRNNVGVGNVATVNAAAQLFSDNVKLLVDTLNSDSQLPGARFTFINSIRISQALPSNLDRSQPCCQVILGFCIPSSPPCSDRLGKEFYDGFHPTEVVNVFAAGIAYSTTSQQDASPYNIGQLAQLP